MKKLIAALLCLALLLSALPAYAATCTASKANLSQKTVQITGSWSTDFYNAYFAATPQMVSFMDSKGAYNVAVPYQGILYIYRYSLDLALSSTLKLPFRMALFGNVTFDAEGNYYVCWGETDENAANTEVICLSKYNYQGNLLGEIRLPGYESTPYSPGSYWGTKIPFDAGTCSMAVNNGILACNFAREMYSGHQSNFVFYVDCATMKRTSGNYPYCSHSFDQDCIPTSDGGFLMSNHGDAYDRGFVISKISGTGRSHRSSLTFHFREGTNRDHGYNETYAQLGGIAETTNAYVLCASSERTLSLDVAPTKEYYCSYSEARDLFVQILKKDFTAYYGANQFRVAGETRVATGTRPTNAQTELWLREGTTDYGVVWLTNYSDNYFAANPKIIPTHHGQFVLMWERRSTQDLGWFPSDTPIDTWYMIMSDDGTVVKSATSLGKVSLPADADPVYHPSGAIYWATSSGGTTATINVLKLENHSYTSVVTQPTLAAKGCTTFTCKTCGYRYVANYTFPDVPRYLWSYDAVEFAVAKGYFAGYQSGKFGPINNITRQDFVVVLARIAKVNLSKYSGRTGFPDVKAGSYYEAAVKWASSTGVVAGYKNGKFGVDDKITREQLVTILYRYAKKMGYNTTVSGNAASKLCQYGDAGKVTSYAKEAMIWAVDKGIISGMTASKVGPLNSASRGQVATILMNISKKNIMPF